MKHALTIDDKDVRRALQADDTAGHQCDALLAWRRGYRRTGYKRDAHYCQRRQPPHCRPHSISRFVVRYFTPSAFPRPMGK
jgi:hypothetical protein